MSHLAPLISLLRGKRVVALTGAGISTESGIPDYRGPTTRHRVRRPVQHKDFVADPAARARYWARSTLGWPRFRDFAPNPAHQALARLQREGVVAGLITQNVDRLHHKAQSPQVLELHGALAQVRCLGCGALEPRDCLQVRLLELNPQVSGWSHPLAPDGDVELSDDEVKGFRVPGCSACGGVLKPDVVFFGDSVPRARVDEAWALMDGAEALWVVGSSLAVFSGYRFVLRAVERGLPVALVNLGESRGDAHAQVRVEARAGDVLPQVADALLEGRVNAGRATAAEPSGSFTAP